ncbi:MAG: DUF3568 family protein [Deltaproteobacteria bacterium]|nr:DUF3568 family protein [Deltaproteobacteria bacterium]
MGRLRGILSGIIVIFIVFLSGCAPLILGGVAATTGVGTYIYVDGNLATDYHYSFELVWDACEAVVASMGGTDVIREKDVGVGELSAVIDGETVKISAKYRANELTSVMVRVGFLGDKLASQRIHDMIYEHLKKE